MKNISPLVKVILALAILLLIYSGLSRSLDIYFFWESRYVGRNLLFIGLIVMLLQRMKRVKLEGKNNILEKLGILVLAILILIQIANYISISLSGAAKVGEDYIVNNADWQDEFGAIQSANAISGFTFKFRFNNQYVGFGSLLFLIKGQSKFQEVLIIYLVDPNTGEWKVLEIPELDIDNKGFPFNKLE